MSSTLPWGQAAGASTDDLSSCSALVVDSNPTSRSLLVGQLRDFGMGSVVQTSRLSEARRQLEIRQFDVVLCEQDFHHHKTSGQDLLDDLRRNQLLPFTTVFIMVTGEATYSRVAEAAESALDGYLLKPHKASQLGERLRHARARKLSLAPIFEAIEAEDFVGAAQLCQSRFDSRGPFWLYAARVGAELMMRTGKFEQAQTLYNAVVEAKTLPWAKLGVARAQLEDGQTAAATSALERLIQQDSNYSDAYDVLGRAHFEAGRMEKALETYRMAADLTPASITRLQNLGMMLFYGGERAQAAEVLERTVRMGLDSKMFDSQTLVLLAFAWLELKDNKGLRRCLDDFAKLREKHEGSPRYERLAGIMGCLALLQDSQFAQLLSAIRHMGGETGQPGFDFEAATNLLTLLAQLAHRAIQLDEVDGMVDTLGLRFCTSRAHTELLAGACRLHPPYAERLHDCSAKVLKLTETAMALSVRGDPGGAVLELLEQGRVTGNAKIVETAHLVLQRHADRIADCAALETTARQLREQFSAGQSARALLADKTRPAGGLTLRIGIKTPRKAQLAPA